MPSTIPIDFSSAIDNARFLAGRDAALRRYGQPPVAVRLQPGRWDAPPAGGRPAGRNRAAVPAGNGKPAATGGFAHAH